MKVGHLQRCPLLLAVALSAVILSANSLSIRKEPVTEQVLIITTPDSLLQDETEAGESSTLSFADETAATESEQRDETEDATTVESIVLADSTGESWEVDPTASSIVSKDVEIEIATGESNKFSAGTPEPVPDGSKPILPEIYSFRVESNVQYRYSRTLVTSRVANKDAKRAQEVTFSVVLPETAFISKFVMEIDGKAYEAYVKEKEEAKKDYIHAQSQGQSAGLVEKSTRNSNVFNVNVNVKPQTKVTFNLTYEELLSRRLGRYEQAININPDQVSSIKDYQIVVNIEESRNLTFVRVPSLSNDIDASTGENKDAVIERPTPNKATITWSPTSTDQKKLVKEGNSGKFVVQYDVDRESDAGQVLVMQGYFVHFFAPENLPPLRKHVVFILDISGSMWGRKMEQLKESQKKILDDLSPEDYFNIITFSSDVYLWSPNDPKNTNRGNMFSPSYRIELTPPERLAKRQPLPATPENVKLAKEFIESLVATGGTNIHDAIIEALNLTATIKKEQEKANEQSGTTEAAPIETTLPISSPSTSAATSKSTTTTGRTSSSTTQATSTTEEADDENATIVIIDIAKSALSDPITETPQNEMDFPKEVLPPNVQSLIIFLTDGEPTVGITDPPEIQKLIQAANRNLTVPIFSLGFGEGADFPFLKKLSLQNYGFGRKIYEASDASLQLQGFYNEIASPLLANVKFNYTSAEYNVTDLTVTAFPTIFGGTEIAVAGKLVAPPKPKREDVEIDTTIAPSNDAAQQTTELSPETETPSMDGVSPPEINRLSISCDFVPSDRLFDVSVEGSGRDGGIELSNVNVFERPRQCIDFPIPFFPDRAFPPRPTPPPTPEDQFLERLWAYLTIQQLIEKDLAQGDSSSSGDASPDDNAIDPTPTSGPDHSIDDTTVLSNASPAIRRPIIRVNSTKPETPNERALRLALKYGFVTPLTSLVVVKPNSSDVTNAVPTDGRPDVADSFFARRLSFAAPILSKPQSISISSGGMQASPAGRPGHHRRRISHSNRAKSGMYSRVITPLTGRGSPGRRRPNAPQSMPVLALAAPAAYVKTAGALVNRIASHPLPIPIHSNFQYSGRPVPLPFGGPPPPAFPMYGVAGGFLSSSSSLEADDYELQEIVPAPPLISGSLPTVAHYSTTARPYYTSSAPEAEATTEQPAALTLNDITWLSANADVLRVNETDYRIARNETSGDTAGHDCAVGGDGAKGQCSHLQDCVLSAFANNEEVFRKSYFCSIQSPSSPVSFVGTCCPSRRTRSLNVSGEDP